MPPLVISLCDYSGTFLLPWAAAGFTCYAVDLKHTMKPTIRNNIHFVYGDARSWIPPQGKIAFLAAFPPCTHTAVSGAKHFKQKGPRLLTDSIDLFNSCLTLAHYSQAPFFIENPVSTISSYIRKPDYIFNPCDYAGYLDNPSQEAYTKKTCLWTGNGFIIPPKKCVEPVLGSKMHTLPPTKNRQEIREKTPLGFAIATFLYNRKHFPLINRSILQRLTTISSILP